MKFESFNDLIFDSWLNDRFNDRLSILEQFI